MTVMTTKTFLRRSFHPMRSCSLYLTFHYLTYMSCSRFLHTLSFTLCIAKFQFPSVCSAGKNYRVLLVAN